MQCRIKRVQNTVSNRRQQFRPWRRYLANALRHNVVSDSDPLAPLSESMTSSLTIKQVFRNKKLSYRRGNARCTMSVEILSIAVATKLEQGEPGPSLFLPSLGPHFS